MKISVLPIGQVEKVVLKRIQKGVMRVIPDTTCKVIDGKMPLREITFDKKRKQYRSHAIIDEIQGYAVKNLYFNRVLGVVNADIFVPKLNFVFGEAVCPGKVALISLWRLRPEFYGEASDAELFYVRAVKEAVHELGHTFGLRHCSLSFCVMHFSNGISDTDVKYGLFCDKCYFQVETSIKRLG